MMGTSDGSVGETHKIVDHGSDSDRWTMVLVAEGYQAGQLDQFHTGAESFMESLFSTPPFHLLRAAVNAYRIDVSSTDSGADDPAACGGTGATARTFFDASFCNNGIRRLLEVNTTAVVDVVNAHVAQWNMIIVLVNSPVYGGSGGPVAVYSMASGAIEIGLHEMGHTAFGLADEYPCYKGCGIDTDRNTHPAVEPSEPNVTTDSNRSTIKWGDLIAAGTPVPTTKNADCTMCDPQANPLPDSTVGAYEGAHWYHCGAYRAQFTCRMRTLGNPFCTVCQRVITRTLTPHLPSSIPVPDLTRPGARIPKVAHALLIQAGLKFTDSGPLEITQDGQILRGSVVGQQPAAGTLVQVGSVVALEIGDYKVPGPISLGHPH